MNGASEPNLIDSFGEFIFAWDFSSPPAVLLLLLAAAYTIGTIRLAMRSDTNGSFWSKVGTSYFAFALLAFALAGPLDYFSGDLFAMHMSQHLVIAMFAAPLLLVGRPMPAYIWALPLFIGTLYGWHIPAAYNGSLENEWVHLIMHFTMFSTAVLFWWPIVGPPPIRTQLNYPQRIVYLLLAVTPTALLAAIITLTKSVLYDFYLVAPGHFHWSTTEDQRVGGLLMWIPGNFVYLATMTVLFFKWFAEEERKTSSPRKRNPPAK
jgi:putative membrane protein